ncbi:MAG TPA: DUF1259 domain-containing protein [Gemmatimonadaceae bacterium]|nr:DUF1259 domain-containing protein [Gemmatimonadaceae bacterium]
MSSAVAFLGRALLVWGVASAIAGRADAQARRTKRPSSPDWSAVENALGRKGTPNPGGVIKFSFPRSDLSVVVNGVTLKPTLALGSWVAFQRIADHAMVMGDLVLLESEVTTVMASLQQNGVDQTALHNHLLGESPRVMYMHIRAIGNAERIAKAMRTALEFTNTPLGPPSSPTPTPTPIAFDLDTATVAKALGVTGKVNGGVYQLSVPRRERICDEGQEVPPTMGVATAINFQPTLGGKAAITGDFVLLGREVNPVLWTLSENGIEVTAIHSHMIDEQPRLFFMHFWANDDAAKLARGLRAALDRTNRRIRSSKARPCHR